MGKPKKSLLKKLKVIALAVTIVQGIVSSVATIVTTIASLFK